MQFVGGRDRWHGLGGRVRGRGPAARARRAQRVRGWLADGARRARRSHQLGLRCAEGRDRVGRDARWPAAWCCAGVRGEAALAAVRAAGGRVRVGAEEIGHGIQWALHQ